MNRKILNILVGVVLIIAVISVVSAGCTNSKITKETKTSPTKTQSLKSIKASPSKINLAENATQQLKITAAYTSGPGKDVTTLSTYNSSDDNITTITPGGLVMGITAGSAIFTISYAEDTVTKTVKVHATVK